jgi:putative lipoprotein
MIPSRLLLALLLLPLAGCQTFFADRSTPQPATERLQGEIRQVNGQLQLQSCQGQRTLNLLEGSTALQEEAQALMAHAQDRLFADLRGALSLAKTGGDGQLNLTRIYRLQREGHGCDEENFKQLILRGSGHEPGWTLAVTTRGMLLVRPGESPIALPYLEEQLPGGQLSFTSEANQQRLDLWVAPQRCVDSASGTVSHLSAELRLDGQTLRGCAYYGGARDD